jgi:prephenate dehydrogenase/chorismate mutase
MDDLKKIRDRIDWLDEQIASLLNERMRASDRVGEIKRRSHKDISDPSRETNVLNQVKAIVQHPLLKANISNIYGEIMQESKIAQKFFMHLSQPFHHIGIIGLGLIGGSICKALKTKASSLMLDTIDHPSEDHSLAHQEGWIDNVHANMSDLIEHCDLIILAVPLSMIIPIAKELKKQARDNKKVVVIDVGGVKEEIAKAFEKLSSKNIEFIATHPMAGKELPGFANSQATLFVNRPWIVCPHQKNLPQEIHRIEELLKYLGSNPIQLEAAVHDQQAALVSHLPAMLAKSYFEFVHSISPESLKIAGPGFQSFTRLAHDNPAMQEDTFKHNHKIIEDYLNQWIKMIPK